MFDLERIKRIRGFLCAMLLKATKKERKKRDKVFDVSSGTREKIGVVVWFLHNQGRIEQRVGPAM